MLADIKPDKPVALYYSYHQIDQRLPDELGIYLASLQRQGWITTSHRYEGQAHWEQARITLLLVSPEYLADNTCYEQMIQVLTRVDKKHQVIPILLRPINLKSTPLHQFSFLPRNGRAISLWKQRGAALADVADSIYSVVENLLKQISNFTQIDALSSQMALSDILPLHNHHTILKRENYIQELYAKLIQSQTSVVVLSGLRGIGKSTLAAQVHAYAEQQRLEGKGPFTDEALWLQIQPSMTLRSLTMKIAMVLGQFSDDLANLLPEELAIKLFYLLKESQIRCLIVLNNFEVWLDRQSGNVRAEYAGVGEWLDLLNRHPCSCRILMTAHSMPQSILGNRPTYMEGFQLHGFTHQEVTELLQLWQIEGREKDLTSILEVCDGHPSALVLLDKLLRTHHISLATLLEEPAYQRLWTSDLERNLFNQIYEQLDAQERSHLLAFATYRQAIPWSAAYQVIHAQQPLTEEQFQRTCGTLLVSGLLQVYTANRERLYVLHPLIAEFARGHFSSDNQLTEDIAHSEAARYYHHLCLSQAREEPRNIEEAKTWIEAIWHYYQAKQWQAAYDTLQQSNLFACLQRWGEYAALLEIYTLFLHSNTWQPELAIIARMNNELGEIYSKLGVKDKAQHHFKQALQYSRTAKVRIIEVKALNNLGSIYRTYGQIEQALVCYQDAMHLCDGMQEYGEQGVTFNNLGRALQDLGQAEPALKISKKRYRDAIIYYKQALKMYNSEQNVLEVARTLNNLGEVHGKIGRSKETLVYFSQALDCFRSIGEKRGEGIVCNHLGTFYRKAEQYVDALEYYTRALRIFRSIGTQGDEAIVLRNLGHVYIFAQRNNVALACFLLARDIFEEMHQPERGVISRGLQALLAEGQSFEQAVTAIGSSAPVKLEKALEQGLY